MIRLYLFVVLFCVASSITKNTKKQRRSKSSIQITSPNQDATTSTKIAFKVIKSTSKANVKVRFYLNDNLIREFSSSFFKNMKDRSISMDISNIPKQVKHNITFVLLNKSNKILSTATRESWLLDTWLDIAAKEDDVLCSDNQCDLQSNNFAAPFYASVAGVFNKDEMNAILQFTKLNRKLYTDTTVGEVEKVDGKYRRTKKIIVPPKQGVISMIYNRLEKVAKVLNQRYWRFRLDRGLSGSSSLRKLSMTVQLTEASDYNGGYLDIMTGRNHTSMPKTKGVVSIFPSYMLHRVSPVTNGERESIVLWFTGCEGYQ